MSPARVFRTGILAAVLAIAGASAAAGTLSPGMEEALLQAGPDDLVPAVLMMEEFPDQKALLATVRGLNREDRRAYVISTMRNIAASSQQSVHAMLAGRHGDVLDVRVLWGINGVALQATPEVIERLADLPGVRRVLYDHATAHPEISNRYPVWPGSGGSEGHGPEGGGPTGGDTSGPNPEADIAPEVVAMGAQRVWNELGYTGAGVIVAVIDTGLDPTHPDLADHIWTNLGEIANNGIDDDGNGHIDDTWGWDFCADTPPVVDSHGTQVAGQVAGDGTNGTVTGMAPDTELMSLGIDCDTPSRGWEASDYAIAHGAHIITQSYSWWWTDQPDYEAFRRQTDIELAAGVIHANSAGNHGGNYLYPVPYNISTPANCPAPWIHTDQTLAGGISSILGVGNISWSTGVIDSSSSLGPAAWEDIRVNTDPDYPHSMAQEYQDYPYENGAQMGLLKPDLSAYGTGTTATCPGPYYCGFSGTSSATPHVSGTLALMLQSNPGATPEELAQAIMTTTEHRGDPGKNNVYGTGLVQAFAAVSVVESVIAYNSHTLDDTEGGNGDLAPDPGERVVLEITVESRTDDPIEGLEVILSTTTAGVTIHDRYATYPTVPARGTAANDPPHFTLTVEPGECGNVIAFDMEMRFGGEVRRSTFHVRVGDEMTGTLFHDDFEADLGWSSDPGGTTTGAFVREDPIGVLDNVSRLANPEDDSSDPGVTCWVTGNGELGGKKGVNNNDVDGGAVTLLSPPFGEPFMLSLDLSYDRWYYDVDGGNSFRAELSNDGGFAWTVLEEIFYGAGGWEALTFDLFALFPPTDDMRLRFIVDDDGIDDPVEGAIDEVLLTGKWIDCEAYTPSGALPPNPVGDTLLVDKDLNGHAVLAWDAPPVDGGHDAATVYRIDRAVFPSGSFDETGSATVTGWMDVDALGATESFYYLVHAENAGGGE